MTTAIPAEQIPQLNPESVPMPTIADGYVRLPDGRIMSIEAYQTAWNRLSAPFPENWLEYRSQSKGGPQLTYVGHAGITMRLNEVDPGWWWEPLSYTEQGQPQFAENGLWMRLHVLGTSRIGFGDPGRNGNTPNGIKEVIGDGIRNCAMRMGVGTYLWSKSEYAAEVASSAPAQPAKPLTLQEQAMRLAQNCGLFKSADELKEFARQQIQTDRIDNLTDTEAQDLIDAINKTKGNN